MLRRVARRDTSRGESLTGLLLILAGRSNRDGNRNLLHDLQAETLQRSDFARTVGQQTNSLQFQVGQNLRADADFALRLPLRVGQGGQARLAMKLQAMILPPSVSTEKPLEVWCR